MKKLISLFLTVLFILPLVSCNSSTTEEKVSLSVLCVNTDYSRNFVRTIQNHFPEVDLQVEYHAAANNPSGYVNRLVESGNSTDIVYSGTLLEEDLQKNYLLDLSAYDFAGQYSISIMNQRDVDGALYMLPGTYSVFSMLYNKSLFEEKGWTVPTTNDEFVALCKQIREETDIIPVTHCGFAVGTYWRMLGALAQSGFLSTPEGAEWTKAYAKGDASFETSFGDAIHIMKGWKDAGVLDESDAKSDNNDMYAKLLNREAAMAYPVAGLAILGEANNSLMCLNLTGEELFSLLEGGHSVTDGSETAVFDYYWSGIDAEMKDGKIVSAVLPDGTAVKEDENYRVMICTGDYDTVAYPDGEDTGMIVSDAYRAVMDGKTIAVPDKLCR